MKKYLIPICTAIASLLSISAFCQNISTIAGTGTAGFFGDGGAATAARINNARELCMDAAGNIYFTDWDNHRIRKITPAGTITTVAGTGVIGFSGDGGPATAAQLNKPYGIAVDNIGNIYFSDEYNHRIRKINAAGTISTIAGTGATGFSGDGGPATSAKLWFPLYMSLDASGNLYFSDNGNHRIRKITPAGTISTAVGTGAPGFSGDGGPATSAQIYYPGDVTFDATGNMYFTEMNIRVRKVNTSGIVSTIGGTGATGFSGDGGPATAALLNHAECAALDNAGNIYLSDNNNNRIRKISASGIISTIAGTGTGPYSGDGIPAITANINNPAGVWVDPSNNIYVIDVNNQRIRKITSGNNIPTFTAGAVGSLALCVDELPTPINTLLAVSDLDAGQTLTWSVVTAPSHGTLVASYSATSTGGVVTPTGTSYMPTAGYTGADMFKVQVYDGLAYDTITINVTVSDAPSAGVILGIDSVCMGSSITLTATAGGGVWSYVTGAAMVSMGVVTGIAPGLDTAVYTVTNACGTATAKKAIKVISLPDAGVISGTDSVCVGNVVTLSESTTGGVWSHVVSGISTVSSGGVVTGVAGGMDTILYTATNVCGTAYATFPVKVLALPNAGIISGIDSVCPGQTITLSGTATGGVWGSTVSGVTTVTGTGIVSGVATGYDTVTYTVTNSCGTAKAKFVVKVLSVNYCHKLSVDAIAGNKEECVIYPNPSGGKFTVLISSVASKEAGVMITDVAGRKLKQFTMQTNVSSDVDMDLKPGVYFLSVTVGQRTLNKKIMITR